MSVNIIGWFAGSFGEKTHRPRVLCSKFYSFSEDYLTFSFLHSQNGLDVRVLKVTNLCLQTGDVFVH